MVLGMAPAEDSADSARDEVWFDRLFAEHATAIHRYFVRRAPSSDVEDLSAEVFMTAWRRRTTVPEDFVLPWLYRTASYVLSNYRRKPTLVLLSDYDGTTGDSHAGDGKRRPVDPAEIIVEDSEVKHALGRLSPRDRRILMLHAWEGLDGEELALALGITRGGAAAALSRARSRLREAWESP